MGEVRGGTAEHREEGVGGIFLPDLGDSDASTKSGGASAPPSPAQGSVSGSDLCQTSFELGLLVLPRGML